jgi:D-alanyl-D-alanine carboxypeptidase (penicillin-binding protein 5/6)
MQKRLVAAGLLVVFGLAWSASAKVPAVARDPYLGAVVLDADTGQVIFEDNADAVGYPASVLKLMDLLIILEKVQQGVLRLDDAVPVTAEASKIGGSQVYLAEKEVFPLDEMLYALMIQSANDAATALAIKIAGSKEAFVQLMNEKAKALGMTRTKFTSVHGLPPSPTTGGEPDTTTARDLSLLARELAKYPDVFRYTSTQVRWFRNNTFEMRNHNKLLGTVEGVDGFKTGYFGAAGFSIVATAKREGVRIIAVVMGSTSRQVRDAKAAELLAKGFLAVPRRPQAAAPAVTPPVVSSTAVVTAVDMEGGISEEEAAENTEGGVEDYPASSGGWLKLVLGVVIGVGVAVGGMAFLNRRRSSDKSDLLR